MTNIDRQGVTYDHNGTPYDPTGHATPQQQAIAQFWAALLEPWRAATKEAMKLVGYEE